MSENDVPNFSLCNAPLNSDWSISLGIKKLSMSMTARLSDSLKTSEAGGDSEAWNRPGSVQLRPRTAAKMTEHLMLRS